MKLEKRVEGQELGVGGGTNDVKLLGVENRRSYGAHQRCPLLCVVQLRDRLADNAVNWN
jgi:hypothetical protein